MTYAELKLASMQKMFHNITTLTENESTKPYLDKMPYIVNCAILRASVVSGFKKKYYTITKTMPNNLIYNHKQYDTSTAVIEKDIILTANSGNAYKFYVCGKGKAEIYAGTTLLDSVNFDTNNILVCYKSLIENDESLPIKIVFKKSDTYVFSYPGIFNGDYSDEDEIPETKDYIEYDLKNLATDFYSFNSEKSVITDHNPKPKEYIFSSESVILIHRDSFGSWKIPYLAYPCTITSATADNTTIDLPKPICAILPYYIASELYLEDDSALSIGWRNKFESSLSQYSVLLNTTPQKKVEFINIAGDNYDSI